ncbi:hypothetical protein K461DRAFT_177669 [Myriangium duriaei CBS 260.36]|uniref:Uncharacterized protein n=1 Tax=Myriangium duriaei CBS 260.36 TaxID=1168546 RepID=A0A9P4IX97_9PEZI|nr:hypothetical protein K461DRAFT_177669 [Myriangium duriaei CBS 260.36]
MTRAFTRLVVILQPSERTCASLSMADRNSGMILDKATSNSDGALIQLQLFHTATGGITYSKWKPLTGQMLESDADFPFEWKDKIDRLQLQQSYHQIPDGVGQCNICSNASDGPMRFSQTQRSSPEMLRATTRLIMMLPLKRISALEAAAIV